MKLVLHRRGGEHGECVDWLTALTALQVIPDATSVQRLDPEKGDILCLWKQGGVIGPAWRLGMEHATDAEEIIARIEAGEDV